MVLLYCSKSVSNPSKAANNVFLKTHAEYTYMHVCNWNSLEAFALILIHNIYVTKFWKITHMGAFDI